ncbi:hypothetical protein KY342_05155 [Candidatus Woesearchaeota archaeon]|nr:hypothetical protein [Candidatus Woesearchaeota archaeon]
MRIHVREQMSAIDEALACGSVPNIIVRLKPTTPKKTIDAFIADLQRLGVEN